MTSQAPALPDAAIRIQGLTKTYGGKLPKQALKGVDLTIPRGSIFGLLGPNGAGKSTLINILAGLVTKTSGQVEIWDHDIDRKARMARASIGIVPQEITFDPYFTPEQSLNLQAGLYGVPRSERDIAGLLDIVGLGDKAKAYARALSGGMKRRLMIAKAMVHQPPILVLDEPTAGVDVELRRQLWEQVRMLNKQGVTILLTTHYLEEAERLCDEIAIINHGQIIAQDTTEGLLKLFDNKVLEVRLPEPLAEVPALLEPWAPDLRGNKLIFTYKPSQSPVNEILRAIRHADLDITDISTKESDLEDTFVELTKEAA
jgi:ABC-2 type transport system ATP-binding protein